MSDDETELPADKIMSRLFKGLQFFLQPNNNSAVTKIRRNVARQNSAIVNHKFNPKLTSHILVDTKINPHGYQVRKKLVEQNIDVDSLKIPILSQDWLVDSTKNEKLLNYDNYLVDISEKRSSTPSPSPQLSSSPDYKRRRVAKPDEVLVNKLDKDIVHNNPNAGTIALLEQMFKERELQENRFKARAYRIAIDALWKTNHFVKNSYEAIQIPGIGQSIAEKIEEIVKTDKLKDLDILKEDEETKLLKLFKGIYSVGTVTANRWIREGMKSLEDIKNRDDNHHNHLLGLEYYDDWNDRIPRKECTIHYQYMSKLLKDIDSDAELTISGSYRRGYKTCGDIDFIITKPNAEIEELREILVKLLDNMKRTGYHKCSLSHALTSKWFGGCALLPEDNMEASGIEVEGKCRRVDLLLVPWREKGAAFIYFTGNDELNKRLRLIAKKKGLNLNETGLYRKFIDDEGEEQQELLESFDERKIFEILGAKWREPTERNVTNYDKLN